MLCKFSDLRRKEVINICDGKRLGYIWDAELQMPDGVLRSLIVPGPCRFFGIFGRGEEYCIPWDSIKQIGDDVILIDKSFPRRESERNGRRRRRG